MPGPHTSRVLASADALERSVADALAFAAETDVHDLLLRSGEPSLRELARLVGPVDHVGFLARPAPIARLAEVARRLRLAEHRTFPSRVLARELAARSGLPQVPTTIFKALGPPGVVEVFMPDAPDALVDAWIDAGIGTHIALGLPRADDFPRAIALLLEAGFTVPPGLGERPIDNPDERVLVEYLDGVIAGRPLRLELCHTRASPP